MLYHVSDNTLVDLILILILIKEFIESSTDNVSIVFTSQYIPVVVVMRQSDFVIEFIESTIFTNNKFQIVFTPCI